VKPISNPPNPWRSTHVEWLEEPPEARLEVFEEEVKSVVSENDSPDVGFRFSINPYRGCAHGCAYCYARPSHQFLGFGSGTDFERKIVVKVNAPEALRRELERPSWKGETLVFSGNTDCYQPLEASYGLTRRCLEVCLEFRQPVSLITKGVLVRRDLDVWARLAKEARASAHVSIPFLDPVVAKGIEPGVAAPARRFEAMKALAEAGVDVGISLAPVVPGLNDADVPELLERARDAGARSAFLTLVRLPAEVLPVFTERVEAAFPGRARKVLSQIRQVRGGRMYDSRWGNRMRGDGPRWDVVRSLFDLHCRRLGLHRADEDDDEPTTFRRPPRPGAQATLFDVEEGPQAPATGRPRGGEPRK
jgi:DNA repair photolyase